MIGICVTYVLDVLAYVKNDYNVIIVQWDLGSKNLNYAQSASNTRSVGAYIGHVARNLIQNGGSQRSRLYCVGHSLGSHVCGHAGATEKFGRITGTLMIEIEVEFEDFILCNSSKFLMKMFLKLCNKNLYYDPRVESDLKFNCTGQI